MLKNYIKIALRNLAKNKTYVLINVFGLGLAVATCIIAWLNFQFDAQFDQVHENRDHVFFVKHVTPPEQGGRMSGVSPMPMGPELKREFPQVTHMTRYSKMNATVKVNTNVFNERIFFADPDFPEMFTLTLLKGNWQAFKNKNEIVLTEKMAEKYFFGRDPIDKILTIMFDNEERYEFAVGAVVEDLPMNSTVDFKFLIDYRVYMEARKIEAGDWKEWGFHTFFMVNDPLSISSINSQLPRYIDMQNSARPDWVIPRFEFTPLATLSRGSSKLSDYEKAMFHEELPASSVISPIILALFILLIACINFINTSIAVSGRRLKEIGLRKMLGGNRWQLILQLMSENILLCLGALLIGVGIAEFVVPAYSSLWAFLEIKLNYFENVQLILFLAGLLICTAIISGAYPAFYITSFEPIEILKGTQKFGGNSLLSKVLLTFQFGLSIAVVILGIAFAQNASFMKKADLGIDMHKIINLRTYLGKHYTVMLDLLKQHADVNSITSGQHHVLYSYTRANVEMNELTQKTSCMKVLPNYLETMNMKMAVGESFNSSQQGGQTNKVILNETAVKRFGMSPSEIVGREIIIDSISRVVVGVVKDFHQGGFWEKVEPMTLMVTEAETFPYLVINADRDKLKGLNTWMKKEWESRFPETPYESYYMSEGALVEASLITDNIKFVAAALAVIATFLSVIGLFALVSLSILKRHKEISIRKIFGASVTQIARLVSQPIFIILLVASVLALPTAYYLVEFMMGSIYELYLPPQPSAFIASIGIVLIMAIFTVGFKVFEAAKTNPAEILRDE